MSKSATGAHGAAGDPGRAGDWFPGRQPQQRARADVDGQHAQAAVQRGPQPGGRAAGVGPRAAGGVDHDQVPAAQVGDAVRDEVGDLHVVAERGQHAGQPLRGRRERVPRIGVRPAA